MVIRVAGANCKVLTLAEAGSLRLMFDGSFDALSAPLLRAGIEQAVGATAARTLVLDLSRLQLLDAVGARVLLTLVRETAAQGASARVTGAHGQPRTLLQLLGRDHLLTAATVNRPAKRVAPLAAAAA
jgi:anti-anti-sigma factor